DPAFDQLTQLVQDGQEQQQLMIIRARYTEWFNFAQDIVNLHDAGGPYQTSAINLLGKQRMDALRDEIARFIATEAELRDTRIQAARSTTQGIVGGGVAVLLVLGIVLALFGRGQVLMVAQTYQQALATVQTQAMALQASEERFRVTLASIGDAVIATDIKGH